VLTWGVGRRAEQFVIPFVQNCPQPWWAMLHAILPQLLDFFVKRLFASWAEMQRRTQGQAYVFILIISLFLIQLFFSIIQNNILFIFTSIHLFLFFYFFDIFN
jgi:hypothetical protein